MTNLLIKFILTQFSNGAWGFATKAPAKKFTSSTIMGRLSTFNTKLGRAVSQSSSPIPGVEGYIFLDDELQSSDSVEVLQDLFKDGAYILCDVVEGEFVQVPDAEPMTLADVKEQELSVASAPSTQPSMAS